MARYFLCTDVPKFNKLNEKMAANKLSNNVFVNYCYTISSSTRRGTFSGYNDDVRLPKFSVGSFYKMKVFKEEDGMLMLGDDYGFFYTIENDDLHCFKEFKFDIDKQLIPVIENAKNFGLEVFIYPHQYSECLDTITWCVTIMGRWPMFNSVYSTDMVNGYLECWKHVRWKTKTCQHIRRCMKGCYNGRL